MNFFGKITSKNIYIYLLILALALLVFGNVIRGEYLYDDLALIVENTFTKSFSHFFDWFTSTSTAGAGSEAGNLWRPIPSMIYTLMYSIFGLSSVANHILNILLHSINGFLVYKLLDKLSFKKIWALLAAIIFIVHPVQVEAVSYISGVPDLLSTVFVLIALNLYAENHEKKSGQLIKICGFFILALMTKESSVVLFPLAILIDIFNWNEYEGGEKAFRKKSIAILCIMTITFIITKFTILNFRKNLTLIYDDNPYTGHIYVRIITFISILIEYIKLLIYPVDLYLDKGQKFFTNLMTIQGACGITILGTIFIGAYKSLKKKKIFMLGGLWFLSALAPVSGLVLVNALYYEHWLYIPIIGVLILSFGALNEIRNPRTQKTAITIILIIAILFSARTIIRNHDWLSGIAFFNHELKYTTTPAIVHHQLGTVYLRNDQYDQAIKELQQSIALDPNATDPRWRLCLAYYLKKELTLAAPQCAKSLELDPNNRGAMMTMYNIAVMTGNTPLAAELNQKLRALGVEQ